MPILRHTWVFKLKRDDNGAYTIFKARGCVDGSQQKHGIDYAETFAPTAREDTFKLFMHGTGDSNELGPATTVREIGIHQCNAQRKCLHVGTKRSRHSNSSLQIAEGPVRTEAISTKLELGLLKETD